jgi:hypothetical protein
MASASDLRATQEKTERTRVRHFAGQHRVDQPSHLAQLPLIRQLEEDFVKLPIPAKRTAWLMRAFELPVAGELVVLSIRDLANQPRPSCAHAVIAGPQAVVTRGFDWPHG